MAIEQTNEITTKIINHFELDNKFPEILNSTGGIILGSVSLYCYINEPFIENQDLDIFIRTPFKQVKEDCEREQNRIILYKVLFDYLNTLYYRRLPHLDNSNEIEYEKSASYHYIHSINTFKKNEKKIQIIILYNCTFYEYLETFDFNPCRIILVSDGYNIHLNTLHFNNIELDMIKHKVITFYKPLYIPNLSNRIKKYMSRGFMFFCLKDNKFLFNDSEDLDRDINNYIKSNYNYTVISYEQFIGLI